MAAGARKDSTGQVLFAVDGSTDKANIDNEIFMAAWCDTDGTDKKIHTQTSYFHIGRPSTVNATGLFQRLSNALRKLGCAEVNVEHCSKLVGIGSDGAATNKGLIEAELNWVFWMWCLARRLELAVKDALKGTAFGAIDDMLLKLYYLYEKSPKKCIGNLRKSSPTRRIASLSMMSGADQPGLVALGG